MRGTRECLLTETVASVASAAGVGEVLRGAGDCCASLLAASGGSEDGRSCA